MSDDFRGAGGQFKSCRTRKFGGDTGGPPIRQKKIEIAIGGYAISNYNQ